MYILVAPNTTFCPDTPANQEEFRRLKAALLSPGAGLPPGLRRQEARENSRLRKLRAFLPGHEPDR